VNPGLPPSTGRSSTRSDVASPILLARPDTASLFRIVESFEVAGLPTLPVTSKRFLDYWVQRGAVQLAILDLSFEWGLEAGSRLSRQGMRVIGLSDDETAQMRALREDFIEAFPASIQPDELVLRVRALIRDQDIKPRTEPIHEIGGLRIDTLKRAAYWKGSRLKLGRGPFEHLRYLVERSGRPVSKEQLMQEFRWAVDNSLHQAMWQLRRALGPEAGHHIVTHHGYGYGFQPVLGSVASTTGEQAERSEPPA
jgi:DNA-binding response OmpR family regulator